ncbi:protein DETOXIFICATION 14-like isoform X3 [Sesamum indicum]|uniref:Protein DETOXIFICATION 14-like isoform X3 n=1 Tax=Sesamum indicum TaxID=4182 RepID=A0A6I9UE78_SESIN|nr:protein DETOXIFICATION 14-like isoform X3 [Sesamum indicum]
MEAEVPLLTGSNRDSESGFRRWGTISRELNRVNFIALPMIVVTISQYLLRTSPIFMLGHLDELSLSSASIATSLCNVTGFSVLFGMASALETLCGQAYGAGQYLRVGTFTYGAILCLFLVCIPVSLLWIYTEKLLIFFGQDPLISAEAGKFAIWLIPTLFPYAILQSLVRYLQTQSVIIPMLWSSLVSLCFQLALCWAFIFKLNLGNAGAALSIGISYWVNVILLVLYVRYSTNCKKTRSSFSKDVFVIMREFFQFAIPSAVMVCLEWWSFELVILLSGVLPNPQLETSVLSICLTITSLHYHIPYSFGAAASIMGYAFSDEKEVVNHVQEMVPFLCISIIMDSLQAVLSGVARGSGWQHIGAYVNLGAYYLVGIPVALLLGFVLHLKGEGLWSGLVAGATVQSLSLSLITGLTNWEKQAREARERIFAEKSPAENQAN